MLSNRKDRFGSRRSLVRLAFSGFCGLLWFALPAESAAKTGSKQHGLIQEVLRTGAEEMVLQWRAHTPKEGGRFRLYVSTGPGDFYLIREEPAPAGTASYRHRDQQHYEMGYFYQLRYVQGNGAERVIGTIVVRTIELSQEPAAPQNLPSGKQAVTNLLNLQPSWATWRVLGSEPRRGDLQQPEPEERPPRA